MYFSNQLTSILNFEENFTKIHFQDCPFYKSQSLLNIKMGSYQWRDPMSHDRLIVNMGIPIPGKDSLYIETGPRLCQAMGYITESYFSINSLKSIETGPRLCQAKGYITVSYFSINSLKSIETGPRLCQAMGYITVSYFSINSLKSIETGPRLCQAMGYITVSYFSINSLKSIETGPRLCQAMGYITVSYFSINSLKSIQNLLPQTYLRFLVWTTKFWLTSRLF